MEPTVGPGASADGRRAAEVLTAQRLPRSGGPLLHRVRMLGAFVSELLWGLLPAPSVHDVVVTRRDDGSEVLRVPAGDPFVAGDLLEAVTAELETATLPAFLRSWDVR